MKIDCHVHITPPEIIRHATAVAEREPYFKLLMENPKNKFATAEEVVHMLDAHELDQAIVFGFGFQDMGRCSFVNDYTIDAIKRYPDRLIGWMNVLPHHKDLEKEVIRCHAQGLRGIGELFPEGQHIPLTETKVLTPLYALAKHYRLPILLHANEPIGHDYKGKTHTSLKELEAFIRFFQEVPIVLAHFGGGIFFYELMKEVRETFKHVYYDTAATIFLYEPTIYQVAKTLGILDKVLFGTDFPLVGPKRYVEGIHKAGLSEVEIAQIMGENAKKLVEYSGALCYDRQEK